MALTEERERTPNPFAGPCEETMRELYQFLDGELTEERRRTIEVHLDHCGPCVEVVSFESELRRVVADRCREEVPPELRDRIRRVMADELRAKRRKPD